METLELQGGRLAYWAEGDGPPLVFIHGAGTSGELWHGDLAELAGECRLIVYDRRGYGASSESPRDWRAHRADAEALIDALGAAPAIVVGYSGGGTIALDLALARPDLFARLVLLDPAFDLRRSMTPGMVRAMLTARLLRRIGGDRRGAAHWMRYVGGHPDGTSAFDRSSPERRAKLLANASAVFDDAASGKLDHLPEERLADIEIPTTIVHCRLSPPFLQRSVARLRELMPQARTLTLENSGHHVSVDAREELLALLRAELSARAAAAA